MESFKNIKFLILALLCLAIVVTVTFKDSSEQKQFSFDEQLDSEEVDCSEVSWENKERSYAEWEGKEDCSKSDHSKLIDESDLTVSVFGKTFTKCVIMVNPKLGSDCVSYNVTVEFDDGTVATQFWERASRACSLFYLDIPKDTTVITKISVEVLEVDGEFISSGDIGDGVDCMSDNVFRVHKAGLYCWIKGGFQIGASQCGFYEKATTGWGVTEYRYCK